MASRLLSRGNESQYLAHHFRALAGCEQILRMRRTFNDDKPFRFRSASIMCANAGKPQAISARIAAGDNIELAACELFRVIAAVGCEKDNAVKLARTGLGIRLAHGIAAEAATDCGDGLDARRVQIAHSSQHIRCVVSIGACGVWRAVGIDGVSAEVDSHNCESRVGENLGLVLPTLFVEAATMCEDNAAVAIAIEIAVNRHSLIRNCNRDGPLCECCIGHERESKGNKAGLHSSPFVTVLFCSTWLLSAIITNAERAIMAPTT